MLMDGGSDAQACFWKLVRHLDRIDAVLLTHVGTENLPGVNAFLERKVAESDLSSDIKGGHTKSNILFFFHIILTADVLAHNREERLCLIAVCFRPDVPLLCR